MIYTPINTPALANRLALLLAGCVVAGCGSGGSSGELNTGSSSQILITEIEKESASLTISQNELVWTACANEAELECATLLVPMDYSTPDANVIEVEMARITRIDRSSIRRTLLVNPGGPGGSGLNYLSAFNLRNNASDAMLEQFDFVSFDPRGIGLSTPVACSLIPLALQDLYTVNSEEIASNLALSIEFADLCVEKEGDYLQQLSSFNVVNDMNEMRKALGLAQIDFLGFSYGSRLAALYLQTFPDKAGRFVIDGSLSPDSSVALTIQGGIPARQNNIDNLAAACIGFNVLCDPNEFQRQLQQRTDELGAAPSSLESALLFNILQYLALRPEFGQLVIGRMAAYLVDNDVSELQFLDNILGISEAAEDVSFVNATANIAVLCGDDAQRPTLDSLVMLSEQFNTDSDLLAELSITSVGHCASWPESVNPLAVIATNQAPVSLVIGGLTDAQTPLVFAEEMAAAIGGQFLRSNHLGHTTVFTGTNVCTDNAVDRFFLFGELPTFNVCELDGAVALTE